MLDPEGATLLAELTFEALKDDNLDYVGGLEMGAVPLAGAIAQLSWIKGPRSRRSSFARSLRNTARGSRSRDWPRARACKASAW